MAMNSLRSTAPIRRIVPEDNGHGKRALATSFVRAAVASLVSADSKRIETAEKVAARMWPSDPTCATITKAASSPADSVTSTWAGALTNVNAVVDLLSVLSPSSAGAALLAQCLAFNWPTGVSGLSVPTLDVSANYAKWIAQAAPFPVVDFVSSRATGGPKKLGVISTFTREMFSYSTPAIEQLVRLAIAESVGLALDARLFSNTAADTASPPGLFVGIPALTAATNPAIPSELMAADLGEIIAAVSSVSGNNPIVIVASPRQAAALRVRTDIDFPTFSSAALPDKTIVAVATNALFSVGDTAPRFETSLEALYHSESSAPQPIGSSGNVVALRFAFDRFVDHLALLAAEFARRQSVGLGYFIARRSGVCLGLGENSFAFFVGVSCHVHYQFVPLIHATPAELRSAQLIEKVIFRAADVFGLAD
jgi:hypothetical protein